MGQTIAFIILFLVVGFILFLFELLTPSFGVFTALGLIAMGSAVYLAFTISPVLGIVLVVVLIFAIPTYFILLVKFLPGTKFGGKLFLRKPPDAAGGAAPEAEKHDALVGKTGTAETQLRPSGAIRIEGQRVIAVAESGIIEKGQTVKVIKAKGTNVVVRPVSQG